MYSTASGGAFHVNNAISKEDTTPIVVVIPGLTSDSDSAVSSIILILSYLLISWHFCFKFYVMSVQFYEDTVV